MFDMIMNDKEVQGAIKQHLQERKPLALDAQQSNIVNSKEKNILVIAGAGSGKTRVLTERVKHLLNSGVPAKNIIAITFTNMAADEMHDRLKGIPCIKEAFIGTIHSLANKIYTKSKKSYQLLTEDVELLMYEEILRKYPSFPLDKYKQYLEMRKKFKFGRISDFEFEQCLTTEQWKILLNKCPSEVKSIRQRDSIITFDELIEEATEYFAKNSIRIQHLLVDELQDIDSEQYTFILGLNAENNFFVGDDWQSIYGFKGGNVEIFMDLDRKEDFYSYYMCNNYRNAQNILQLGSYVIDQHPNIIDKDIVGLNPNPGTISYYKRSNTKILVELLQNDKNNWRDWFVLTRSNKDLYKLADELDDNDIDYCFIKKSDLTLEELQTAMKKNQVKLMTVHAAKGLENKKVILYGNFPVDVPGWMKNYDIDERKVMYVGITRAQEELYIFN